MGDTECRRTSEQVVRLRRTFAPVNSKGESILRAGIRDRATERGETIFVDGRGHADVAHRRSDIRDRDTFGGGGTCGDRRATRRQRVANGHADDIRIAPSSGRVIVKILVRDVTECQHPCA